ncbi:hypothetical protein LMG33818_000910 [Halomonadaceae bacterium LMG 33818]|uniref:DUF3310 domain-containing protein n=1 Tax=Cernens ardua TaxID=3402176 RepID=UPI003EDC5749
MNRDELLTKLAMELAEFPTSILVDIGFITTYWTLAVGPSGIVFIQPSLNEIITEKDWLQRRRSLEQEKFSMNIDSVLTKIVMELPEWPTEGKPIDYLLPEPWSWNVQDIGVKSYTARRDSPVMILTEENWKHRRRKLINEPLDNDAPDWAEWVAQDEDGEWCWHSDKPTIYVGGWGAIYMKRTASKGKLVAGHNWRKTLRRVKREETAQESIQDDNTVHEHDPVNHPKHYKLFPDLESIDVIQRSLTPEQFAGFCMGSALKYRLRAGEKGNAAEDLAKANWYREKLAEVGDE